MKVVSDCKCKSRRTPIPTGPSAFVYISSNSYLIFITYIVPHCLIAYPIQVTAFLLHRLHLSLHREGHGSRFMKNKNLKCHFVLVFLEEKLKFQRGKDTIWSNTHQIHITTVVILVLWAPFDQFGVFFSLELVLFPRAVTQLQNSLAH